MNHNKTENSIMHMNCFITLLCIFLFSGCAPTVKVAAPDKPITINLNVKIEHQIKVQVEKDLDDVLSQESGLF